MARFVLLHRGGLRLLGAPGWNLERGPISNEEEGGYIYIYIYIYINHCMKEIN